MSKSGGAQFTPGPWVVDEDYEDEEQQAIGIVKEGRGYIAGIHILASCNNGEGFTAEDRANAALIAAAPVMYEALRVAKAIIDKDIDLHQVDYDMIVNALAQAEGRQG